MSGRSSIFDSLHLICKSKYVLVKRTTCADELDFSTKNWLAVL